LNGQSQAMI